MTRLRQVVLVAEKMAPVADELQSALSLRDGFNDPGVKEFGLENVVFPIGDRFIEIVAPIQEGTTAGRLLDRDGPGGYMAIFQSPDLAGVRKRAAGLGIRTVWEIELDDIAASHFHPKDIGGAIVSVDQPDPPQSWRWGGPEWIGDVSPPTDKGIRGITVRVDDPQGVARRWADVLGLQTDGTKIVMDDGRQEVRFEAAEGARAGISEVRLNLSTARHADIGGVIFTS